jgi:CubicO group peptidase (beta-lactamase class C family)
MAYQRDPELDIEIEAIMEELHVVGAAVATFCTDNVYHLGHYGFAQLADSIPVSETTFFLNGSVSKVVTATVGLQAWEDLDISLDVEVADYLDFDIEHPTCPDSALTLRHTYTHTAGFPDVYPATQDTPICEDLAEALDPAGQHYDPGMWFP